VGAAAGTLGKIGAALVSGTFSVVTILILTAFMLGSGTRWYEAFIDLSRPSAATACGGSSSTPRAAISGYVAGALVQASVAAFTALIILTILASPSRRRCR